MRNDKMQMVPSQHTGAQSLTRYVIYARDSQQAKKIYYRASANLLNVNKWHQLAGTSSAKFQLMDEQGDEQKAPVQNGHFLRISIPMAPASTKGNGYDWVKVEKVESATNPHHEWIAIRVRPSSVPFLLSQKPAHFFSEDASSSFMVERQGRKIIASIYGRNEKPNTKPKGIFNKVRNIVVATAAILGLNKPQWKSLAKGWLKK